MIVVTGDEMRNNAYIFAHQGSLGYTVAKEIRLPGEWKALRASTKAKAKAKRAKKA